MHLDVERAFSLKFSSFHVGMLQIRDEPLPVCPARNMMFGIFRAVGLPQ